jgi:hypothetical protein
MKFGRLILSFLLAFCAIGCRTFPEPPSLYSEEVVLRVWDVLDDYYGSEAFFECELLPVRGKMIRIVKPYGVSHVAVVAYSPAEDMPVLFQAVQSNPGENEVVIEGTTLHFHPCREDQRLFVAWVPDLCRKPFVEGEPEDGFRK